MQAGGNRVGVDWQLYIDESGDLDSPAERAGVVAGVLVNARVHPAQANALRRAIEEATPGLAYPYHAGVHGIPAGRLAGFLVKLHRSEPVPEHPSVAACRAAADALRAVGSKESARFVAATERGREPSYEDLCACDAQLAHGAPAAYRALRAAVDRDRVALRSLLATTADVLGTGGVSVVAAARGRPTGTDQVEAAPDPVDPGNDLHLELLETLFERLYQLLRAEDADTYVRVRVASRGVATPELPAARVRLRARDVGDRIQAAAQFPFLPEDDFGHRVRVYPEGVEDYRSAVHPGLVLADFAANRLRRVLIRVDGRGWGEVVQAARRVLPLPVELAAAGLRRRILPAVADRGDARKAVHRAFRGESWEDVLAGASPLWAREQGERWCKAAEERS